jgi:uncharacterized protein YecE (DUF72 family)
VAPMSEMGRLGAVVLQYPPWFRDTPENHKFLLMTRGLPEAARTQPELVRRQP